MKNRLQAGIAGASDAAENDSTSARERLNSEAVIEAGVVASSVTGAAQFVANAIVARSHFGGKVWQL